MSTSSLGGEIRTWAHKRWWPPIMEGVLLALFGILVLIATGAVSNKAGGPIALLYIFLAIFLILHGAVTLIGAIVDKGSPDRMWGIVFGIIAIVLGILAFIFPKTTIVAFCWLMIVFVLIAGILAIMRAMAWRKIPGASWGWMLTFGILMILLAVYCLIFPIIGSVAISFALLFWIGFLAVIAGAFLIWAGVRGKSTSARFVTIA